MTLGPLRFLRLKRKVWGSHPALFLTLDSVSVLAALG